VDQIRCPKCDKLLGVSKVRPGSLIACPKCTHRFRIPDDEDEALNDLEVVGSCCLRPCTRTRSPHRWHRGHLGAVAPRPHEQYSPARRSHGPRLRLVQRSWHVVGRRDCRVVSPRRLGALQAAAFTNAASARETGESIAPEEIQSRSRDANPRIGT
jgi:hypothetical protein